MRDEVEIIVELSNQDAVNILGELDRNVSFIEEAFPVRLRMVDNGIAISGAKDEVEKVKELVNSLALVSSNYKSITHQDLRHAIQSIKEGEGDHFRESLAEVVVYTARGKMVRPKTLGQQKYVRAIGHNDVVFGIGPAGTGKTYLAMAMAVKAFKNKEVNRIILTRPAVEAGESLGFLPGDLQTKVDPYLRPLYDALFEIMGYDNYQRYLEKNMIEVAPLAYMRGRTLDNSFVILDEAQNTTNEQMKMFLTRLGFGSKAVITGDITQIDLPTGKKSGLVTVQSILKNLKGLEFVYLQKGDIVRHPMVQRIIDAYEKYDERKKLEKRSRKEDEKEERD